MAENIDTAPSYGEAFKKRRFLILADGLLRMACQMDELFAIDEKARKENLNPSDRRLLRLEKAKPLLEQIKAAIQAARGDALPKSVLAKACNYTLRLWQRLIRFLDHPALELSNNLAENAIRPVALGRRNWIHIGSKEAGPPSPD